MIVLEFGRRVEAELRQRTLAKYGETLREVLACEGAVLFRRLGLHRARAVAGRQALDVSVVLDESRHAGEHAGL